MALKDLPSVWVDNTPDSLLDLAIQYCTKNPEVFCTYEHFPPGYVLRDGLLLPEEICERMLASCKTESNEDHFHRFMNIFNDTSRTRVRHVDLSNSIATDTDLEILTNHSITELNVNGCRRLTQKSLGYVAKLWAQIQSLNIGSSIHIFMDENLAKISEQDDDHLSHHHYKGLFSPRIEDEVPDLSDSQNTKFELPVLRTLSIHKMVTHELGLNPYFMRLLKSTQYLTNLDLYKCELSGNFVQSLVLKNLISLVLCDVINVKDCIPAVCQIKSLRHLDISSSQHPIRYDNPNQTLKMVVESLEHLVSLDISGTNLAGTRTLERYSKEVGAYQEETLTDIPGLASRVNRPLEFLGLLNTAHEACYRHHIPAKKIAGDASEEQVLTAGQAYCGRKPMIQKVLNDLFQIFRISNSVNTHLALDVVMEAMQQHLKAKHIQVSGSASLFYIVKGEHKHLFNIKMRRKIIKVLIDAMFSHYSDVTMLRNGCLTLIHFKIPEDVFFDYERLASLLLLIVAQDEQDDFVQRIGVYLLNSLACQVDGIEKKLVGDRGAITIMLQVIEKRLQRHVCDEVMETAWSTMWNVTDETPINCARFLEGKGMDLFLGCLQAFPQKPELLRNMMGLLGNVAEVKELRSYLMKDEYLSVFSELLNSKSDGIEVSYNAAGVLSHIASDGPDIWSAHRISAVKRREVLQQMVEAIEKWSLGTKRNINYRSFKPILRLLTVDHTPEARHWAVWALANLTTVYPEKYCTLLKEEGGIELLKCGNYIKPNYQRICELAAITIFNCTNYEKNKGVECSDSDDNIEIIDIN